MITLILLCLLGALIELDDTYVGQIAISSPLITGIIFGLLTGNTAAGLQVGIFMSLLFFDYAPVGNVISPNGTISAFTAVILVYLGMAVYNAFFWGVAAGMAFKLTDSYYRRYMGKAILKKEKTMRSLPERAIGFFMLRAVALQFIISFFFLFTIVFLSKMILPVLPEMNPNMHSAMKASFFAAPWLGLIMAFKKFKPSR